MGLKYKRLSTQKVKKILRYFCEDLTATQTARLVSVQRKTVNRWYKQFRVWIAEFQEEQVQKSGGKFEIDESYFGGPRKKTHALDYRKRGRGAENKVPVFGIKKRDDGTVYTEIIKNAEKSTLLPIIKKIIKQKSTIYSDGWRSYDGLVFDGYKHYRINHSKQYSNRQGNHINGIENFWGYSKQRLAKFHGLSRESFFYHLKECEFRYNKQYDMMKLLEKKLQKMVL
jgi:transposase